MHRVRFIGLTEPYIRLPRITAHHADVADSTSVETAVAKIINSHGKIDSLVTSAGFRENFEAITYPVDRLKKLWDVNVNGTYFFCHCSCKTLDFEEGPRKHDIHWKHVW